MEPSLSVAQVAEALNVSDSTVRRLAADGELASYRVRHQRRFRRAAVEAYIAAHEDGGPAEVIPLDREKTR